MYMNSIEELFESLYQFKDYLCSWKIYIYKNEDVYIDTLLNAKNIIELINTADRINIKYVYQYEYKRESKRLLIGLLNEIQVYYVNRNKDLVIEF